jgi:PTH1 family peptidyl-tRNA hydrolase
VHLVLGLGNPGRRYEKTRHNAGFLVIDRLAARWGEPCDRTQFGALVCKISVRGHEAVLGKPQGFMNLSGQPAVSLRGFYKVEHPAVIVVHDELDIPFGQVRIKVGGGHGGHNGVRDISARFGDGNFVRVRFGVGRPPPPMAGADWVLSTWDPVEQVELDALVDRAADAVEAVLLDGADAAMNRFNTKAKPS